MTITNAMVEMLIKYYGIKAQTEVRITDDRCSFAAKALERADGNIQAVKSHIDAYVNQYPDCNSSDKNVKRRRFIKCFESFGEESVSAVTIPTPAGASGQNITDNQVQYSMSILEQAVIQLISKTQSERIEAEIMGSVENKVREFIASEYGAIERKITTIIDGKKVQVDGVQHEKFETVLKFVSNNEPVFLTGPAGSGKNVLCKQIAQALGLKFYFTNSVTQEYKLTGFTDANGRYQETQFFKAFTEGGVFMLDEMDASIPETLIILNAAIANRYFDFPAPIGYREAHPDFRVIAAGNTTGNGADYEYIGRNQLDAASLDRFAIVEIDYSPTIENAVAENDAELVEFCRDFRKCARAAGVSIIVSYRGIGRLKKMLHIMQIDEALATCLVKGLESDSVRMIAHTLPESRFKDALERIAN